MWFVVEEREMIWNSLKKYKEWKNIVSDCLLCLCEKDFVVKECGIELLERKGNIVILCV